MLSTVALGALHLEVVVLGGGGELGVQRRTHVGEAHGKAA